MSGVDFRRVRVIREHVDTMISAMTVAEGAARSIAAIAEEEAVSSGQAASLADEFGEHRERLLELRRQLTWMLGGRSEP